MDPNRGTSPKCHGNTLFTLTSQMWHTGSRDPDPWKCCVVIGRRWWGGVPLPLVPSTALPHTQNLHHTLTQPRGDGTKGHVRLSSHSGSKNTTRSFWFSIGNGVQAKRQNWKACPPVFCTLFSSFCQQSSPHVFSSSRILLFLRWDCKTFPHQMEYMSSLQHFLGTFPILAPYTLSPAF